MRVPLFDLTRQYGRLRPVVEERVLAVLASQQFVLGKTVADFEAAFAQTTGCAHAVGMSSGTDAQLAILMALGIGPGDAVLTTPYTFFATAGCIHRVGAEAVFTDIRPDNFHLDPASLQECLDRRCQVDGDGVLRTLKGNRVRALIPVHLFGTCCDMEALRQVVAPYGLTIIEDAAQAVGAEHPGRDGQSVRQAGALGDSAFFSFFPTKNLGGAGDGGLVTCADGDFAEKLRRTRNHGMAEQYHHHTVGGNFRLDALQAAVLHAKLPFLAEWNAARRKNAARYAEAFSALGLLDHIQLPAAPWADSGLENHHTYHQFVIRAEQRDDLLRHLKEQEIGHSVYYPVPLHLQECFASLGYRLGDLPEAERASRETIALPIFPELEEAEIAAVAEAIARFY